MHFSTSTFLAAVLGASSVSAHVQMTFPPPFKSKLNQFAGQDIDYSMTAPLNADGSNYPCKGYQSLLGTAAGAATASFAQGEKGNITLEGGAIHNGGSCQISVSTDNAKTFTVIQSFIGGCPAALEQTLDFTMPDDVPAGEAVLAWSWNNEVGNREFYMNCAAITVTGASSKVKKDTTKRATAFTARPQIFVANLGTTTCAIAENQDVIYPDAGPDVITSDNGKTKQPTGDCGPVVDSGSSSGSASSAVASSAAATSTAAASTTSAAATTASAPGGVFITAPTTAATSSAAAAKPTTLATVTASASKTASASIPTVSSGTTSSASANAVGSACNDEGAWNCISGSSFQRCASGMWSAVTEMAAGMECTAGTSEMLVMAAVSGRRLTRRNGARWAGAVVDARSTDQE